MHPFSDTADRQWRLELNVTALERIRAEADVDLLELVDGGPLLERLMRDPVLLCRVLYALCREQAEADGVAAEDFGRGLAGKVITDARTALVEEIVDFFHQEGPMIQREAEKLAAAYRRLLVAVNGKLDEIDVDKLVERALASTADSSGDSPASSASTPGP